MKKVRTVLVVLSALYVVLSVIFLLNFDSIFSDFNVLKKINYLQAWIVAAIVLLTALIIAGGLYIRSLKSRYRKLEKEHNTVKGRVYEIEEERKAEIARQQAEEEDTERKLEAFNSSLKGRNREERDRGGAKILPGHVSPSETGAGHEGLVNEGPESAISPGSGRSGENFGAGPDMTASDEDDDKPVQY